MHLSEISIRNPIFSWMMMFAMVLLGAIGLSRLGLSQMPNVDFPVVNIVLTLQGANPSVMESDVVDPLEEVLLTVEGVEEIRSTSNESAATITVELGLDRDVDVALQEIQTKIAQVQNKLPDALDPPILLKANPDDTPIIWVALTAEGKTDQEKMIFVKSYLKDKFQKIPGVGEILLGGYVDRTINVYLDPNRLARNELTVDDIANTLLEQNIEVPSGKLENKKSEVSLRAVGDVPTVEQLSNIYINSRTGSAMYRPVKLKEVASVEDGLDEVKRISRFNRIPAVGLGIKKIKGSDAVAVGKAVKLKMEELKPFLPKGYNLSIANDNTTFISESVEELIFTLILSIILTGLVCRLFLGSWSSTGNVLLAIPTSIIGTFLVLYILGFTLNTFTLLGLSLAVGIVVDDAIMVLENISRHKEMGKTWYKASLEGAAEIRFAALAATLAIIAIFLPVAFMQGVVGRYFLEFGITVAVAVVLSLFEALSFTPMRASRYKDKEKSKSKQKLQMVDEVSNWKANRLIQLFLKFWDQIGIFKILDPIMETFLKKAEVFYEDTLKYVIRYPITILVVSTLVFIFSLGFFLLLKKEFIPSQDLGRFILRAKLPVTTSIQGTDSAMRKVEEYLLSKPGIERYMGNVGGFDGSESNAAMFFVSMQSMGKRPISSKTGKEITQNEIFEDLRKELKPIVPEAKFTIIDISQRGFSAGRGYPVELVLTGPDWDVLAKVSDKIRLKLEEEAVLQDIDTDYVLGQDELRILPNRDAAAARGVSMANIGNTIGPLMGGKKVSRFTENGRSYDVRIKINKAQGENADIIPNIKVRNTYGEFIRLQEILIFESKKALKSITRVNRDRAIKLFGNPPIQLGQTVSMEKSIKIAKEYLPEGYSVAVSGSAKTANESTNGLVFALCLGILISYMVLASQFNSLKQPLYVLLAMPFSFSGALVALYVTGQTFNMYSFIGLIMLLGLVKKNSILLVEFVNFVRSQGKNIKDSILEGCPVRLRPVLMTSFASIAAAIPPALALGPGAETRIPMAVTILGGLILSTLITFIVVPAAYVLFEKENPK
ncbi:efflux RND transporter permease subunit [Leptospira congkakensis]|uniref:Efflux RND transporter permease subunit n=2 Tax=Leptospira congkakensis TaxID=2484932 RepID=A0A4Z1A5W8_9LEPT|nr:efflux RND transporter permease subunit [Leptospira congkakensis]TGL94167.1 efflux RND transporter permease subunit [Leptospira congkakensis]TGL94425.1 efflux RND transporter permease subunit [Leptospira congkakensis]